MGFRWCLFPSSRGGVDAQLIEWSRSELARPGRSLTRHISECVVKTSFVSDLYLCCALSRLRFAPVSANKVASQLFINGGATPPLEEGNLALHT